MNDLGYFWPSNPSELRRFLQIDIRANKRDPKALTVLILFRLCQFAMGDRWKPRLLSFPLIALYRILTEFILGMEMRPKTSVGPGLQIFHGFGLVINDHCDIGAGVVLRNGVTIGNRSDGGAVPKLEDGVEIGCGAIILGDIVVGRNAKVGAGSVVLSSVEPDQTVVGNPARPILPRARQ